MFEFWEAQIARRQLLPSPSLSPAISPGSVWPVGSVSLDTIADFDTKVPTLCQEYLIENPFLALISASDLMSIDPKNPPKVLRSLFSLIAMRSEMLGHD